MGQLTPEAVAQVRPPEDVIEELHSFEEAVSMGFDEIKTAFYEILGKPYLDQFDDLDERARQASKVLLAQYSKKLSSGMEQAQLEFKVLDYTAVVMYEKEVEVEDPVTHTMIKRKEERQRAKVFGLFAGTGKDEKYTTKLGILMLWGDACQTIDKLEKDQCYTSTIGIRDYEDHYELSTNEPLSLQSVELELPRAAEMITEFFEPIPVGQARYNLGKVNVRGDYKLVKGRIENGHINLSKAGKNLGFLTIIDPDASLSDLRDQNSESRATIMFTDAPEFANRYMSGSDCYFLVEISMSEQFGLSMFGQVIIPIMGIPNPETLPDSAQQQLPSSGAVQQPTNAPVQQPGVSEQGSTIPSPAQNGSW